MWWGRQKGLLRVTGTVSLNINIRHFKYHQNIIKNTLFEVISMVVALVVHSGDLCCGEYVEHTTYCVDMREESSVSGNPSIWATKADKSLFWWNELLDLIRPFRISHSLTWTDESRGNYVLWVRFTINWVDFKWTTKQNDKWVFTGFEKEKVLPHLACRCCSLRFLFWTHVASGGGIAMGKSNTQKPIITLQSG